ncbi:hypothetical protein PSTG_19073 [Puccinia striiformis f. sp. tritici PST-78]|uniref:Uncharacterized protein n=1 Tax=Puccinia striiformis f. sp. tritici PST-78 TaxID=1165861 RepID=A0A0L0UKD2_9BASI|nr:hypothetical protein PSTG_19073 [Puccinia striiformis f. sp. tritici PST-78]
MITTSAVFQQSGNSDFLRHSLRTLVSGKPMTPHAFLSTPAVIPSSPGALLGAILQTAALTSASVTSGLTLPTLSASKIGAALSLGIRLSNRHSAVSKAVTVKVPSSRSTAFGTLLLEDPFLAQR